MENAESKKTAERFVGQKRRSMLATIPASVDIHPAPLRPPQRAADEAKEDRVADTVIEAVDVPYTGPP